MTIVDDDVLRKVGVFTDAMLSKLRMEKNQRKAKSWGDKPTNWLIARLLNEVAELIDACNATDKDAVVKEAADVANFAFMIADHEVDL